MNSIISFDNLVSWLIQVSIIALAGTALPSIFRIRHPKSQLAYFHAVLIVSIVFPLIQPRQYFLLLTNGALPTSLAVVSKISWATILVWLLLLGIAARAFWLLLGYRQVCRFRRAAALLSPIPDSIRSARNLTRADAMFRVTSRAFGPATLGYLNPVILLPESFVAMDAESQLSIACHELIHVRRNDWVITIIEEMISAVFWFNPAVLWLLSRIKLSREQVVDTEVVDITAARTSYVQALLSMAVVPRGLSALPAAPFFTQGHLHERMRSLLTRRNGSRSRLILSYVCMFVLLVVVGWNVMLLFPLKADAQNVPALHLMLRPPVLHPWSEQPATVAEPSKKFNVRVPAPNGPVQDNIIYVNPGAFGEIRHGESEGVMPPPPPPPPPPPQPSFPIRLNGQPGPFVIQGLKVLRPGNPATPDDFARVQAALGNRVILEVRQNEDGIVQRVTVLGRRFFNEDNVVPFDSGSGSDSPDSAIHAIGSH